MLKAILHGKAGRIDENGKEERVSWRKLFKAHEDLLTAAFFSRWAYLSGEAQHAVLSACFGGRGCFYGFREIECWHNFSMSGTGDGERVEPDVLIHFENFNLLVEVKPPQGGSQYLDQWRRELTGYYNDPDYAGVELRFLAIGMICEESDEWLDTLGKEYPQITDKAAVSWKTVAFKLAEMISDYRIEQRDKRILADMQQALGDLYGVSAREFSMHDLIDLNINKINCDLNLQLAKQTMGSGVMSKHDAGEVMLQIRTAHRLVAGYYQRLFDAINKVKDELGLSFYVWKPSDTSTPGNSGTEVLHHEKWAWDMLPGTCVNYIYYNATDYNHIEKGQYLLDFHVITDSALLLENRTSRSEPDGLNMAMTPEESKSMIRCYLYLATKDFKFSNKLNCYTGIYQPLRMKQKITAEPQKAVLDEGMGIVGCGFEIELSSLIEPDSSVVLLEEIKSNLDFLKKDL